MQKITRSRKKSSIPDSFTYRQRHDIKKTDEGVGAPFSLRPFGLRAVATAIPAR
jgi:hypothetical protein